MSGDEAYRKVFGDDDESLSSFLRGMREFDRSFCEAMISGDDFPISFEVHGNCGKVIHCRPKSDRFERPKNASNRRPKKRMNSD